MQDYISVRVPKTHGTVTFEFNMQNLAAPRDASAGCCVTHPGEVIVSLKAIYGILFRLI
jgi:hypothetical protein